MGKVREVFLVHGEPEAKQALQCKIQDETGIKATIPETKQAIDLNKEG